MPASDDLRFRSAGPGDVLAIAELHADSWRRHYRSAFSAAFLDSGVVGYLLPVWTERLAAPHLLARTILAESNARAFYAARGGVCVERDDVSPPGGDPARLNGKPMGLRYAWRDLAELLRPQG